MNDIVPADTFKNVLTRFENQVSAVAKSLEESLPAHISIEKFQRTLMAAVKAEPELLRADRASLINACEKAALDGLIPDKREAALVIFKRNYKDGAGNWQQALEVTYMPMVYGLRKKILQSNEVTDITAKVVYRREMEEGAFLYEEGTEAMLRHRPMMELSEEESKDENIIAAYSMATYKDGTKSYEVMRRFEIDRVRESSQTGALKDKKGKPRTPFGPWVDWFPEQAKKTVMRRHSKTLPMSGDLMVDVEARELEISAKSTARMLGTEPDAPVRIAGPDGAGQDAAQDESHDTETGEVVDNKPGMTDVDEETARELDAGRDNDAEEGPSATYVGMLNPAEAQHADVKAGESWYSPDTGATKYAHVTPKGIRWYLEPPKEQAEAEGQGNSDAADPHTGKLYEEKRAEILDILKNASDIDAVKFAENMLTRYVNQFPDKVAQELEDRIDETRDRVAEEAGNGG